jgi:hypothetical protein
MSETTKGEFIEKIVFAAVPIMFSCIVYLVSDLNTTKTKLDNKISIVVSPENTPRPNQSAELAREKLRLDFVNEQNESLIRHTQNNGQINLLSWRITELEKLNGKK